MMESATKCTWESMNSASSENAGAFASHVHDILQGSRLVDSRRKQKSARMAREGKHSIRRMGFVDRSCTSAHHLSNEPKSGPDGLDEITYDAEGGLSAEEIANTLTVRWLRNKNGAIDSDASIRKACIRSLSKDLKDVIRRFSKIAEGGAVSSTVPASAGCATMLEDLMALLVNDLGRIFFRSLNDPIEACREAAIDAVKLFVEHAPDLTPHLAYLFPVVMVRGLPSGSAYDPEHQLFIYNGEEHEAYKRGRAIERQDRQALGRRHFVEESEELRLGLCQLVGRMVIGLIKRGTIGVLRPYVDDMVLYLASQMKDPCPAVKVEAMSVITKLASHPCLEQAMKFYAVGLARATLPHLRHRQGKVRAAAVEALWMAVKVPDRSKVKGAGTAAIVDLVGFREDNVLPIAAFYGKGDTTINYLAEVGPVVTKTSQTSHACQCPTHRRYAIDYMEKVGVAST